MPRVLVVVDDPQLLRALTINLQARAYEVEEAGDGASALRLATARRPDVVLMDLGLPDMDGVDVIRSLRAMSRVPVLVLSARHLSEEKVRALDAGADDYVTKPFSMDELLARLRAATRRREPSPGTSVAPTVVTTDDLLTFARQGESCGNCLCCMPVGPICWCVRYADGGGLTSAGRQRREAVRMRAVELFEQEVGPLEVAERLRVSRKSAYQWHGLWREGGAEALVSRGASGSRCRLSPRTATCWTCPA